MNAFVSSDDIRLAFSDAMSAMYRAEVPLYGDLLDIVAQTNTQLLAANPSLRARLAEPGPLDRLNAERHGAIRIATPHELQCLRRLFAVMGMYPVGYYDLAPAGLPVHSTAFRPIDNTALARCAFRIFCSLLRFNLIADSALRAQAQAIVAQRTIVTKSAMDLIARHEKDGGLSAHDAKMLVTEALETFRWHGKSTVDHATYQALLAPHGLIADIVCFPGPHINHLTPRALDIDAAQAEMIARGIHAKAMIEGPPRRDVPILLRQTSFHALQEPVAFRSDKETIAGAHTARFGEIEQRGIALTPKGRALYDRLLAEAEVARTDGPAAYQAKLADLFEQFPDDLTVMRREGLGYFTYDSASNGSLPSGLLDALVNAGHVIASPITYEDFLPVSAAGIFRSNLATQAQEHISASSSQTEFEEALGAPCLDPFALYRNQEAASLKLLGRAIS